MRRAPLHAEAMSPAPTGSYWSANLPAWEPPPEVLFTGIALRGLAWLVDFALWSVYWGILLVVGGSLNGPMLSFLLVLPPFIYFPVVWARYGTTLGMRLLRLKIVRSVDGGNINTRTALLRFGVAVGLALSVLVIAGIGLIALPMVTDRRRRGIHDRIAGTLVVRPTGNSAWLVLCGLALSVGALFFVLAFLFGGMMP
jgi:uncharacterized RDD family membrane protein YckC